MRSTSSRCSAIAASSAGLKCSTFTRSKGGTPPYGPVHLGMRGFDIVSTPSGLQLEHRGHRGYTEDTEDTEENLMLFGLRSTQARNPHAFPLCPLCSLCVLCVQEPTSARASTRAIRDNR